jgi:hypothetical protein
MTESQQEFKRWRPGGDMRLDLKWFSMRVFKGGTVHIKFKDLDLLKKFNIYGCQQKKWLPPDYGKKRYKDMTQEERDTVDAFQGREDYEKVVKRRDFFLVETTALAEGLLLIPESTPDREADDNYGPIPESIGEDGMIAVYDLIEPDPQEPNEEDEEDDEECALDAPSFPQPPPEAQALPMALHEQPAEPQETITKDEWFGYYKAGTGYARKGCRYIIRDNQRIPVTVTGMAQPRSK